MAQTKFTLYKYVKLQGGWRYCKAAFHENVKIKPNVVIVGKDKHEEKHPEGSYYLAHAGQWIPVGDNALEAQRRQKQQKSLAEYQRLTGTAPVQSSGAVTASARLHCWRQRRSISQISKLAVWTPRPSEHTGLASIRSLRIAQEPTWKM